MKLLAGVVLGIGVVLITGAALAPVQQAAPDGAYHHFGYETEIAQLRLDYIALEDRVARLEYLHDAMATNTPVPTDWGIPTLVATITYTEIPMPSSTPTRTPSATPPPTNTVPPTSTPPGSFATPTQEVWTPTATVAWLNNCPPSGAFRPEFTINTRIDHAVTAQKVDIVTAEDVIIVCTESMTEPDSAGYVWMQIASDTREEWFVIQQDGDWWGVLEGLE